MNRAPRRGYYSQVSASCITLFSEGDRLTMEVYQNSGGALDLSIAYGAPSLSWCVLRSGALALALALLCLPPAHAQDDPRGWLFVGDIWLSTRIDPLPIVGYEYDMDAIGQAIESIRQGPGKGQDMDLVELAEVVKLAANIGSAALLGVVKRR